MNALVLTEDLLGTRVPFPRPICQQNTDASLSAACAVPDASPLGQGLTSHHGIAKRHETPQTCC